MTWIHSVGLALTWVSAAAMPASAQDRITGRSFATRSDVLGQQGMVATSHPLASQIALGVLKDGGTAVDAAVAANAALGLMEPTGCGIGGDLFALVWHGPTGTLHGLNASGRSPRSLTRDVFVERGLTRVPKYGPLPVSVPGCVDGWFTLHEKFGRLPMTRLLEPSIDYATRGFPVTEVVAHYLALGAEVRQEYAGFRETFMPGGRTAAVGEIFRNPALASTYRVLAEDGREAFYRGALARTMHDFMERVGGFLTFEDLAAHHSEWVEPISTTYRGHEVWELPPNGQGLAALQILAILEGYDLRSAGFGSFEHVHWFVEAKKLAFEDRAKFYADPSFVDTPVAELLSDEYTAARRALIDDTKSAKTVSAGNPALEEGDTIYLTTADSEGTMVSLIQSNYRGLGSGLCPDGLGFGLQNRGELFDLAEGRANSYAPGKRPFHTIIPAFVTKDGAPFLSFGVMGGAMQPQGHAQILINLLDFDMGLQEAGDAPRIIHAGSSQPTGEVMVDGGTVGLESGFDPQVIRALVQAGHDVGWKVGPYGGYQAIRWDPVHKVYAGASESRKDGQSIGY